MLYTPQIDAWIIHEGIQTKLCTGATPSDLAPAPLRLHRPEPQITNDRTEVQDLINAPSHSGTHFDLKGWAYAMLGYLADADFKHRNNTRKSWALNFRTVNVDRRCGHRGLLPHVQQWMWLYSIYDNYRVYFWVLRVHSTGNKNTEAVCMFCSFINPLMHSVPFYETLLTLDFSWNLKKKSCSCRLYCGLKQTPSARFFLHGKRIISMHVVRWCRSSSACTWSVMIIKPPDRWHPGHVSSSVHYSFRNRSTEIEAIILGWLVFRQFIPSGNSRVHDNALSLYNQSEAMIFFTDMYICIHCMNTGKSKTKV